MHKSDTERALAAEVAALEQQLASSRGAAVQGLRRLREAWGRAAVGVAATGPLVSQLQAASERGLSPEAARAAISQLAEAERWQWEIGTWSTGSGEGLASMREVRTLQLGRAWLLARLARDEPARAAEARALVDQVAADPNRVASHLDRDIAALRDALDALERAKPSAR